MPFKNPHPLYPVFHAMKERCRNTKSKQWKDYGGKGITVCQRWLQPIIGFHNFIADMGVRPDGFTLDRIDNEKNYSPENCRWASRKQQQRNQSVTRKININGQTFIAADLAEINGLKTDTVMERASRGLSYDEIIRANRFVFTPGLALGGQASGAKKQLLTHCKHGHEFTQENTKITKEGWRNCRKCHAMREAIRRKK